MLVPDVDLAQLDTRKLKQGLGGWRVDDALPIADNILPRGSCILAVAGNWTDVWKLPEKLPIGTASIIIAKAWSSQRLQYHGTSFPLLLRWGLGILLSQ